MLSVEMSINALPFVLQKQDGHFHHRLPAALADVSGGRFFLLPTALAACQLVSRRMPNEPSSQKLLNESFVPCCLAAGLACGEGSSDLTVAFSP